MDAKPSTKSLADPLQAYAEFSTWVHDLDTAKKQLTGYIRLDQAEEMSVNYAQLKPSKYYERYRMRVVYRVQRPAGPDRLLALFKTPSKLIVRELPGDPELPQLAELFESYPPLEVLTYRAGVRCTWRSTWRDQPVVCKHFVEPGFADIVHARFEHLRPQFEGSVIDFPQVLNVDRNTVVSKYHRVAPVESNATGLNSVGRLLAAWHSVKIDLPEQSLDEILDENENKLTKLSRAYPGCAPQLSKLRATIGDKPPERELEAVVTHGDFHLGQLGLDGDHLLCFDLDECCIASRHRDLASIILSLHYDHQTQPDSIRSLLGAYTSELAISPSAMRWYLHVQLLNKLYRGYVQLRYRSPADAERQMLDAAAFVRECCRLLERT